MSRETKLKQALGRVGDKYGFIIIDCPPSLGLLTVNVLTAADYVLLPIQCEYYALEGLSQLMNTVKLVQRHLNPALDVEGVVLTMFDARTNLSIQVVEEVKKYFKNKVYRTVIPRNVRLSEAPSFGMPIILYDPKSRGAECYLELAEEVIEYSEEAV
jgi:chromosome partitioning protein